MSMTKPEVELIIIKVSADGQDALSMKIYKNGTVCRYGVGGLPQLCVSPMSFFNNSRFFDQLIKKVPEEILKDPLNYEEATPNGSLEYVLAFYGVSTNGENGEHADWSKATGVRVHIDQQSTFNHPIMGLLDGLALDAAELTNEWYFDVMVLAQYGMHSSTLPETLTALPQTQQEINQDFDNYLNQMLTSARRWNMRYFSKNKTYSKDGKKYRGVIIQGNEDTFSMDFIEINDKEKKSWWKFW